MEIELTTLKGEEQKYEIFSVEKDWQGTFYRPIFEDCETKLPSFAKKAYEAFSSTGLVGAIKKFPMQFGGFSSMVEDDISGITIIRPDYTTKAPDPNIPERLRLVYDLESMAVVLPVLRVSPVEGEIGISQYKPSKATINLEQMSIVQEFGGDYDFQFDDLLLILRARNSDQLDEEYFGRDLKRSN